MANLSPSGISSLSLKQHTIYVFREIVEEESEGGCECFSAALG